MGETQLYSTDKHLSQCIHVHTVLLTSYCFVGNKFPSTVLCAASRDTSQSPQGKVGPLVHCCQICIAFLYAGVQGVHPGPWPSGTQRQAFYQHQNVLSKCPKSPDICVCDHRWQWATSKILGQVYIFYLDSGGNSGHPMLESKVQAKHGPMRNHMHPGPWVASYNNNNNLRVSNISVSNRTLI